MFNLKLIGGNSITSINTIFSQTRERIILRGKDKDSSVWERRLESNSSGSSPSLAEVGRPTTTPSAQHKEPSALSEVEWTLLITQIRCRSGNEELRLAVEEVVLAKNNIAIMNLPSSPIYIICCHGQTRHWGHSARPSGQKSVMKIYYFPFKSLQRRRTVFVGGSSSTEGATVLRNNATRMKNSAEKILEKDL